MPRTLTWDLLQPLADSLHRGRGQQTQLQTRLRQIEQVAGQGGQIIQVVGAAQHGFTFLGDPIVHQVEHLAAVVHIGLLGRLIKQVHSGILQAELSQLHQLLLATGELGEVASGSK